MKDLIINFTYFPTKLRITSVSILLLFLNEILKLSVAYHF